jgi:hypothetical protein
MSIMTPIQCPLFQACPARHKGGAVGRSLYLIWLFVQIKAHKSKIQIWAMIMHTAAKCEGQ